jgi:malonate-semialdehyde dehydrogenase (acetylating)/methylmalonate-semialdehyde dehydrogenase
VRSYVDLGRQEGATLVVDGRGAAPGLRERVLPRRLLFDDVTPEMRIYKEEIFGPVLGGRARRQRSTRRLQAGQRPRVRQRHAIFTRDGDTAREFASRVQAGMVGINVPIPVPMAFHSFGGWKRSLFGDHAVYGMPKACASTRASRR